MKSIFGLVIIILGILAGLVMGILCLVWGIIDIVDMINNGITFWGLFWAVVKISIREIIAAVVIIISFIIGSIIIEM